MSEYNGENRRQWSLTREVPVTLIIMVAIQTGGFIWWLASLSAKVDEGVKTTARLEARLEVLSNSTPSALLNGARMTALDVELERLRSRVDAIQQEQQRRAPFIPRKAQ